MLNSLPVFGQKFKIQDLTPKGLRNARKGLFEVFVKKMIYHN